MYATLTLVPFVPLAAIEATDVGAVRSTTTDVDVTAAAGPTFATRSSTRCAPRVRVTVPSPQPPSATVHSSPLPDGGPITQPSAVPPTDRSLTASPVIASEKSRVNASEAAFVGVAGGVIVTDGAAMSAVARNASAAGALAIPAPQPRVWQPSAVASAPNAVTADVSARSSAAGCASGSDARSRAAIAATCGAACDVPLPVPIESAAGVVVPAFQVLGMLVPGAAMSTASP